MANIPQKSQDATAEAMTAIQEALSLRHEPPRPEPPTTTDLFGDEPAEDARRRPANDDRASIGAILQALHGRPARLPYIIAAAVSAVWLIGGVITALLFRPELQAVTASPRTGFVALVGFAAILIVPIIFALALAHMFRRSRELRVVAESMAEVAMRLAQPETVARESIVTVGQAIRREVAAMGDGVERALARAAELEALVHNEVSALERAYNDNEVRIRDLVSELSNQRETLVNQAEQVRNAIGSVHLDLSHDITSVGDLVAEKVNEVAQRVTRSLTEKGEHITLALGHAGDSMIDALTDRGSNLLDRLETTSERASTAISSASERLTDSLNFKTEHVHDEFAELSVHLQQMMTQRLDTVAQGFAQKAQSTIESMDSRTQGFTNALTETGTRMAEIISARAEEVNSTLRSTGDSLVLDLSLRGGDVVSKLEQTGQRITDTMITRSNAVSETFRDSTEALAQALNSRGEAVKEMLGARLQAFEEMFNTGGTELSEKISRDSTALGNLITTHVTEFDRTVKVYGGELVERLGQRTSEVSEAMRNYLDTFDQRITVKADTVGATLDQRLTRFERDLEQGVGRLTGSLDARVSEVGGAIVARGQEVAETIGAKAAEVDQTLGMRAEQVANNLDSRIGRFEDLLVGRAETVTTQIETRTRAAADALNARMEQLSQSIKSNASEAERSLGQLTIATSDAIRVSASEAERTLKSVSDEVAASFVGKANEIADAVGQRTSEMTNILSDRSGSVLATIVEKGQQFASEVGAATEQAIQSIDQKGFAFTRAMLDNSTELARMINSAGEAASNTVNRTFIDLNDAALKAIEQSKQTATSTVSEMMETHNMLRADTTALFERLREANIMLQEVLSGAHENMSALENTLMLRVSEFVNSMNEVTGATSEATVRVETTIAGFSDVTARVVTDLGQLADQFDLHGRELAKAVDVIDRSNERTESTINERRVQLDSLVATLDIRTEDLDQRLKRFAGLLDESLEAASARAREVARLVSESSAEGSRAITEQYDNVRTHADEERQRATEAMRDIFAQASGDTNAIFRDAAERFADVVQGMKQMASEMQQELEATRAELHRGIFELPQEASESTAQMRRVIVDQIEALAELNRIVARHGRSLDAVEPMRRTQREEPAFAVIGGGRSEPPPPRPAPPPRSEANFAPRRPAQPAPSLTPEQAVVSKGWLSELLNRASRDEDDAGHDLREPARPPEERTARHTIESLDSLSVDIARMIDHDAAADLWDRYKRGERNVFTRRLYTLQGQKAFDEIRRKYRADREFKQTVDRYVSEFERLLEEVSRDDRGQVVARTYLTSETGKVYTMLAHAAGRFD